VEMKEHMDNLTDKDYENILDEHFNLTKLVEMYENDTKLVLNYDRLVSANLDTPSLVGKYAKFQAMVTNRVADLKDELKKIETEIRVAYRKEIANHRVEVKGEVEDRIALDKRTLDTLSKLRKNEAKKQLLDNYVYSLVRNRDHNIRNHIEFMKFKDKTYWDS